MYFILVFKTIKLFDINKIKIKYLYKERFIGLFVKPLLLREYYEKEIKTSRKSEVKKRHCLIVKKKTTLCESMSRYYFPFGWIFRTIAIIQSPSLTLFFHTGSL